MNDNIDEVGKARRDRAKVAQDITPRDALMEALDLVEGRGHADIGKAEHVFCVVMTALPDGSRSFMVATGGSRNHDELLGVITRVHGIMATGGASVA